MELLFAIGQAITLGALAYGAILCFMWRDESDPQAFRSKRPPKEQTPQQVSSRDYAAAAETDPAS